MTDEFVKVPEQIADLMHTARNMEDNDCNRRINEAYRRGQDDSTLSDVEREAVGHCLSYLEGMLLSQSENSCVSIQTSLKCALDAYKRLVSANQRTPYYKYLYSELLRRLDGAFIVCGLGRWTDDWNANIKALTAMSRTNEQLAKLASERYDPAERLKEHV